MNYELFIELITALGIAFLSFMKYLQHKKFSSPLLSSPIEATTVGGTAQKEASIGGIRVPLNIKQELNDCASTGTPLDFTKYGKGAILDLETGDITFK